MTQIMGMGHNPSHDLHECIYIYIYICHICYVPTLTLCHTGTKMIYSRFIRSKALTKHSEQEYTII
jgi:hypothetical protein